MKSAILVLSLGLISCAGPSRAAVSDTKGLLAALKGAKSGDVIRLSPGDYQPLNLANVKFLSPVTITSEDAARRAVLHGVNIVASSGLRFSDLDMTYGDTVGAAAMVNLSSDVVFENVEVHGGEKRVGNGIFIRNSERVRVSRADIHDLAGGLTHLSSTDVTFSENKIHRMSMDGIRGGGSSRVTITRNYFTDFHPVEYAHNDAIQFWTSGTNKPARELSITDNTFVRGDGVPVQGIFMGNEMRLPYERVTISGNAIIGGAFHGITLDYASEAVVRDNMVQGYKDMGSWIRVSHAARSQVNGNTATAYIITDNTEVTSTSNRTIKQGALGDMKTFSAWSIARKPAP